MQILILGAGYAGVRVALELNRLFEATNSSNPAQITLVDQNPYHQHIILFHRLATAAIQEREVLVPLSRMFAHSNVEVCQGTVSLIDPLMRLVKLDDERVLTYDRLVIALGGQTDYAGIEGAREHTWSLRTFPDAVRLRDHIQACFREAALTENPLHRRELLTFAVVGGGFIGCQFAGELAGQANSLARAFGVPRSDIRIALLESDSALLRPFGSWAHKEAMGILDRQFVSVYLNTTVERVEPQTLYVSDERMLPAATIVWTTGIHAPEPITQAGLPTDEQGRVLVDNYLRVVDHETIFAAGDCVRLTEPASGTIPATASAAMRQGEYLARMLHAEMEGQTTYEYRPLRIGHLVSLGPGKGVGNPLGLPISGRVASFLKQGVEKWYLTTLE